jgi:hypothetical protein
MPRFNMTTVKARNSRAFDENMSADTVENNDIAFRTTTSLFSTRFGHVTSAFNMVHLHISPLRME